MHLILKALSSLSRIVASLSNHQSFFLKEIVIHVVLCIVLASRVKNTEFIYFIWCIFLPLC